MADGSRTRCSYKHATIVICFLNVVTLIFLLQALLTPFYNKSHMRHPIPERAKFVTAGEEIRRAMEPMDLIKRIKELQLELESASDNQMQRKVSRQNNAAEISKRLNDLRSSADQNSQKALEEWRKRKMERAKKREMGRNATSTNTGMLIQGQRQLFRYDAAMHTDSHQHTQECNQTNPNNGLTTYRWN